ncbi:hypothetical protein B0I37DRAFT_237791 [Chaetomium sp. MPI-CAGE-AT-0009]|nr:hypothetical protein B0I37DRAFT_237791 [Chaetomium sp. MPI-CAGE-AT-0009]
MPARKCASAASLTSLAPSQFSFLQFQLYVHLRAYQDNGTMPSCQLTSPGPACHRPVPHPPFPTPHRPSRRERKNKAHYLPIFPAVQSITAGAHETQAPTQGCPGTENLVVCLVPDRCPRPLSPIPFPAIPFPVVFFPGRRVVLWRGVSHLLAVACGCANMASPRRIRVVSSSFWLCLGGRAVWPRPPPILYL